MIKISDYIVKFLKEKGIKDIFMLPGGGCIHLVDSVKKQGLNYIVNLHEQGAAIAAEAYAQYKNNVGVALVTTGPGGTNAITAVASAWIDSIPLLIISGQVQKQDMREKGMRTKGFQEINIIDIVKPITKLALTMHEPENIAGYLNQAWDAMLEGRKGPVWLDIPLDVQAALVDEDKLPIYNPSKIKPKGEDFEFIKNLIAFSERPVILIGNGIRSSIRAFYNFINHTDIPVLTTWRAMDLMSEIDPLFIGRPGSIATRGANFNLYNADLVICLGARLDHGQVAYNLEDFAPNAAKIIVDIDEGELSKYKGLKGKWILLKYDVEEFLSILNDDIHSFNVWHDKWAKTCKTLYNKYNKFDETYNEDNGINLYSFINILSDLAPEDSIIIPGSSGTCSEITMQAWKVKTGQRIFNSPGLGAMGFGIPAAIGACIASGKKPVICIEGDGSFMMNMQELEIINRLNLPIKIFVINNGGYNSIKNTQEKYFGGDLVGCTPESGLTLPDISSIAGGFDIDYEYIDHRESLEYELGAIFKDWNKYPVICEVESYNHQTLPRTSTYQDENGKFISAPMHDLYPFLDKKELNDNIF